MLIYVIDFMFITFIVIDFMVDEGVQFKKRNSLREIRSKKLPGPRRRVKS